MDGISNIAPTKGNLLAAKRSLGLATMGYELLDRKRNILVREMMELIEKADELRGKMDETYSTAYEALRRANITLGVCEDIAQSAPIDHSLSMSFRSVMGVELPTVRADSGDAQICYDLSGSNFAFDQAFKSFHNVKLMVAQLAEIENSVFRLAVAIKKTQSRANALKNIIIPGTEQTVRSITDALDEKGREEFSRLKVIKKSKK